MQDLADKLSYVLDIVKDADKKFNDEQDLKTPLLEIEPAISGVLATGNGHKFNVKDVDGFFKKVYHKIEYLFWLSQNVEDDSIFQRLIDFLSHYEKMKREFYAKQHNQYEKDMLKLEDNDIEYDGLR